MFNLGLLIYISVSSLEIWLLYIFTLPSILIITSVGCLLHFEHVFKVPQQNQLKLNFVQFTSGVKINS